VILLLASCTSITDCDCDCDCGMFRSRGREPKFLDQIQEKGVLQAGWLLRTKGYVSTKYEERYGVSAESSARHRRWKARVGIPKTDATESRGVAAAEIEGPLALHMLRRRRQVFRTYDISRPRWTEVG